MIPARFFAASVAAAAVACLSGSTAAGAPRPTVALAAVVGTTFTGPVVVNSNGTATALTVKGKQGSSAQLLEVKDYAGNPILSVPPYGGPAVLGDNSRVMEPGNVFEANVTLWYNGSITLNQAHGGATIYSGPADPNVSPPNTQTSGTAPVTYRTLRAGDRYLQTGGGFDTWVYIAGRWVVK